MLRRFWHARKAAEPKLNTEESRQAVGATLQEEHGTKHGVGFFVEFIDLSIYSTLTLKKAGGGSYVPTAQEIACHFSQDHARVLTLPDFFKNDVGPRVKESF